MPALRAEHASDCIRIFREGLAAPLVTQRARRDKRPFVHPILAPDGVGELTEDEPGHHLWQHGLYVGLNDVNGVGFWTEGLHQKSRDKDGSFHPQPLAAPDVEGHKAAWCVVTEWRSPKGEPLLTETQAWRLDDRAASLCLELDWTLLAAMDLIFGKYAYGGLFLRMPYRGTGTAFNSTGQFGNAAEGQAARWVSVHMPIPGREKSSESVCGMAMLDHPRNPGHPVPWRVDGQLGIAPSRSIAGAWTLPQGAATTSRYRLPVFVGPADAQALEAEWKAFAGT